MEEVDDRELVVERVASRPRDGAVQRLLRQLLLLREWAVLELPQRQPERDRRRWHLRLLPHLRRIRRRPVRVVRVPFADVGPSLIPDWMGDEDALLSPTRLRPDTPALTCDIIEGDIVVVFGAGPVGLFAAKSAWLMGAGRSS